MLTGPCNLHSLTFHFNIVNLWFTGVYFFLFLFQNIDRGGSEVYPQAKFCARKEIYHNLYLKITIFTAVKSHSKMHRSVIVMRKWMLSRISILTRIYKVERRTVNAIFYF